MATAPGPSCKTGPRWRGDGGHPNSPRTMDYLAWRESNPGREHLAASLLHSVEGQIDLTIYSAAHTLSARVRRHWLCHSESERELELWVG